MRRVSDDEVVPLWDAVVPILNDPSQPTSHPDGPIVRVSRDGDEYTVRVGSTDDCLDFYTGKRVYGKFKITSEGLEMH